MIKKLLKKGINFIGKNPMILALPLLCLFPELQDSELLSLFILANSHSIDLESSSSQYLSRADSIGGLSGSFTFEAWVKLESQPGAGATFNIIDNYDQPTNSFLFQYRDSGGTKQLRAWRDRPGIGGGEVLYNTTLSNGTWYHIAARYDLTNLKLYLNGSEVASAAVTSGAGTAGIAQHFRMGGMAYFDGLIDDVRKWNDARTETEINDNKDKELVGNEAGLEAYWKLNNSLLDETSNNYDLTNNNSAVFSSDVPFVGAVGKSFAQII